MFITAEVPDSQGQVTRRLPRGAGTRCALGHCLLGLKEVFRSPGSNKSVCPVNLYFCAAMLWENDIFWMCDFYQDECLLVMDVSSVWFQVDHALCDFHLMELLVDIFL